MSAAATMKTPILSLETLQKFCAPADDEREWLRAPYSFKVWSFATSGKLMVRIARREDVPEIADRSNGKNVLEFLVWNFPKRRDLVLIDPATLPESAGDDGIRRVQIGEQYVQAPFVELVRTLPSARIATARKFNPEEDEGRPIAFVFGDGDDITADGVGLIAPLRRGAQ